jgi:acetyl-CoA C-acetyltransferase
MSQAVIIGAARTPIGAFLGELSSLSAPKLGSVAIQGALKRAGVAPDKVGFVAMGNVLQAGIGQAPARQASLGAGIPNTVPCVTVNKVCGSGMQTIIMAAQAVLLGECEIAVAGGMESMSNAPYILPKARSGYRMGNGDLVDSMIFDGLWDPYKNMHMGNCGEMCADKYGFTREMQDEFSVRSTTRAQAAGKSGAFKDEIEPVVIPGKKGDVTISEDEGPKKAMIDKIPSLKPAFKKDGTITAANASSINDGASAVVVTTEEHAKKIGAPIRAKIVGWSSHANEPEWFTTAPVAAIKKLMDKTKWSTDGVDLWEINEAFAVVSMAPIKEFNLSVEKVNIHGGAVSLGHPIGNSGTRIVTTLAHALKNQGKQKGVAAICIGGGEALAIALERP